MAITTISGWGSRCVRPWGVEVRVDLRDDVTGTIHNELLQFPTEPSPEAEAAAIAQTIARLERQARDVAGDVGTVPLPEKVAQLKEEVAQLKVAQASATIATAAAVTDKAVAVATAASLVKEKAALVAANEALVKENEELKKAAGGK